MLLRQRPQWELRLQVHPVDHCGKRSRRAGAEWFLTSTKFLDHIAEHLGLLRQTINDLDVGGE